MALMRITSPHAMQAHDTGWVMRQVLLALVPGIAVLFYSFGWGVLINIVLCGATALACEAAIMRWRGRPVGYYLKDYSALVTATLLAVAIPPYAPWWIAVVGTAFSIVIAKHLYGGLGYNPFNPAMVGYVVLLISFPVPMTTWGAPRAIEGDLPSLIQALTLIFDGREQLDAFTAATPLDLVKQNAGLTMAQLWQQEPVLAAGRFAGAGWEWANLAFLAGGVYLLWRKIFTWHAPVAMLAALTVMSLLFWGGTGSGSNGSPLFHLLSGATMIGAFFIVTDPVSSTTSNRGRLIYGAAIGVLVYVIRAWGNYPDAVAFAVLLMNFAAPFIDYYTVPRTYGHRKPRKATEKME